MSNESKVMLSGFAQPISLRLDHLNETARQTLRESPLYRNAAFVHSSEDTLRAAQLLTNA